MLIELENLWPHYQRTVEEWRDRFKKYWKKIQKTDPKTFTEKFRRRWTLYLEGVVTAFETHLDLSHIVFVKGRYPNVYPLTKEGKHINADFRTGNQKVSLLEIISSTHPYILVFTGAGKSMALVNLRTSPEMTGSNGIKALILGISVVGTFKYPFFSNLSANESKSALLSWVIGFDASNLRSLDAML